jgi:hypothetical protein
VLPWFVPTASADPPPVGSVALRVAVHRDAGTVLDVAADGAAGQCAVSDATLRCPAVGPVTFRWGPGGPWALVGDTVLEPGSDGVAVVWATGREADEERLLAAPTAATVADLFVRTGDHPVGPASERLFAELLALVDSDDVAVRRLLPDALLPYWRHTASDPYPAEGPSVTPDGLITRLSQDPDKKVRQALASRLHDLLAPGEPLADEASAALLAMSGEGGAVQRAAFGSLAAQARTGEVPAVDAWRSALARVVEPGAAGKAAANTLAALASQLAPGPDVDPRLALARTAQAHLEKVWVVWKAWKDSVPFDPELARRLLVETEGLSPALVKAWGTADPAGLKAVLERWEPREPHSDRYRMVVRSLADVPDSELRSMAGDSLSPGPAAPEPE